MASASVLQKLTQRAKQAEEIISQLKVQIETVKQNAAIIVSKPEEVRVREENKALRVEIERLKSELVLSEIRNGMKQILIPIKKPSLATEVAPMTTEVEGQTEVVPKETVEEKPKQQKGDKGKKAEKTGKEGEPKAKKVKQEKGDTATPDVVDISRLDMRVGKIVAVMKHPDADGLYIEDVDLGEGKTRTIVSGLVKHIPIEEMQDRLAVFMCNLKPAKMRGVLSDGMIMCASAPEKVEILVPPPDSQVGDRVFAEGYTGEPDTMLNPKKKIWETIKPDLRTNDDKVAAYKGAPLHIHGKGVVVAPTSVDVQIS